MRRVALAVGLAVACAGLFAGTVAAGGGRATTVVVYQPFTGEGAVKPSITVDETLSGQCFAGAVASPRRDAWRCMVADDLYDPCFAPIPPEGAPTGAVGFAVCPEFGSPPRRVDRINLTKPLPAEGNTGEPGSTKGLPWVLLARPYAGYCDRLTGTTGTVQGKRVVYDCGLGGSLVGKLDRSSATWTGKLVTEGDNRTLYTVRVRTAWY